MENIPVKYRCWTFFPGQCLVFEFHLFLAGFTRLFCLPAFSRRISIFKPCDILCLLDSCSLHFLPRRIRQIELCRSPGQGLADRASCISRTGPGVDASSKPDCQRRNSQGNSPGEQNGARLSYPPLGYRDFTKSHEPEAEGRDGSLCYEGEGNDGICFLHPEVQNSRWHQLSSRNIDLPLTNKIYSNIHSGCSLFSMEALFDDKISNFNFSIQILAIVRLHIAILAFSLNCEKFAITCYTVKIKA
ncbi:uncharacterized protein LOC120492357 [Pimephales promelas]|uniref:uncharacterized protein LOC120492357 n=1 Tax=Pimephales promelas TaxID=90988 RepID=UPI001955A7F7|nr:uncharacterized protein LOC120492357 [Pimephales promelas]